VSGSAVHTQSRSDSQATPPLGDTTTGNPAVATALAVTTCSTFGDRTIRDHGHSERGLPWRLRSRASSMASICLPDLAVRRGRRGRCSKPAPALRPLGHYPTVQADRGALYQRRSGFARNIDPAQNRQLLADVRARIADSTSPHQTEAAKLPRGCRATCAAARAGARSYLARGGPGRTLNVYLFGTVVLDSGVCWSRPLLARQSAGRQGYGACAHPRALRSRPLLGVAMRNA
jgi:hypothetical protein